MYVLISAYAFKHSDKSLSDIQEMMPESLIEIQKMWPPWLSGVECRI